MKATQLEQMREDFVHIKTTKSVIEDKIEQLNEVRMNFIFFIFCLKSSSCVLTSLKMFHPVRKRLEAQVFRERGPLQEPGVSGWNAHQKGGVDEANGLGTGELLSYFLK